VRRNVTTTLAAGVFVLAAVVAAIGAAVPGKAEPLDGTVRFGWHVWPTIWPLIATLLAAGVTLARRPDLRRPAAAVAAVVAAQIAGIGLVAVRDWFQAADLARHNLATVVAFAAGVATAGTAAACGAVALLWHEPARGWAAWRPHRPALVAAGAVIAVLLPPAVGYAARDADLTSLGQYALTWSLPWGGGLAAAGWLRPRARLAATRAVAFSAFVSVVGVVTLVV
jgi:hypothetical protein